MSNHSLNWLIQKHIQEWQNTTLAELELYSRGRTVCEKWIHIIKK